MLACTIDSEDLAGNVARGRTKEEDCRVCNVLHLAVTAQRVVPIVAGGLRAFGAQPVHTLCAADRTRGDDV